MAGRASMRGVGIAEPCLLVAVAAPRRPRWCRSGRWWPLPPGAVVRQASRLLRVGVAGYGERSGPDGRPGAPGDVGVGEDPAQRPGGPGRADREHVRDECVNVAGVRFLVPIRFLPLLLRGGISHCGGPKWRGNALGGRGGFALIYSPMGATVARHFALVIHNVQVSVTCDRLRKVKYWWVTDLVYVVLT